MEARDLLQAHSQPFELTLRIRHPSMDPAEISRVLRLQAEHSFKAGEPRESISGIAATSVHSESYWLGTLEPATFSSFDLSFPDRPRFALAKERLQSMVSESLSMALTLCTSSFLRTHADFVRRVQTEGGEVSLLVELSPQALHGFTLTPQVGRALSDLGVTVEFEIGES